MSTIFWHLRGNSSYNVIQTAYNIIQNYDVICISETYLDSTIRDNDLSISGYNLIRVIIKYHPNNIKQGSICLYFKESLKLRREYSCFVRLVCRIWCALL